MVVIVIIHIGGRAFGGGGHEEGVGLNVRSVKDSSRNKVGFFSRDKEQGEMRKMQFINLD